jgi:PIN domain nuclease of toxin-antitoxin system
LDTHVAVWYAARITLKSSAIVQIDEHLKKSAAFISAISAWEIGMLVAEGRIRLKGETTQSYVAALFSRDGVVEEPVTSTIAEYAARLPGDFHGDSADRLIVATAALRSARLVTRDERISTYAKRTRLIDVIAA